MLSFSLIVAAAVAALAPPASIHGATEVALPSQPLFQDPVVVDAAKDFFFSIGLLGASLGLLFHVLWTEQNRRSSANPSGGQE